MAKKDQAAVRLDEATLARLDALAPHLSNAGHEATRSDVMRGCLLTGLPLLEKEHGILRPGATADPMRPKGKHKPGDLVVPTKEGGAS